MLAMSWMNSMPEQVEDFKVIVDGQNGQYTVSAEGPAGINISSIPFTLEKTDTFMSDLEHIK